MKISITIDVEPDHKTGEYKLMLSGLKKAEVLLSKYHIKPALFVTCDCIKKHPKTFQKLAEKGWEISLHGYRHERFDTMDLKKKEAEIDKAIKCFKRYLKIKPKGLRAPQFSSEFELIELEEEKEFSYDSSIVQFPLSQLIFFRSKLKLYLSQMSFKSRIKRRRMNIKEIPASSFILPISMFTLRKLPFFIFRILAQLSVITRKDNTLVFLSHSYEFDDSSVRKLEKFISKNKNAEFVTMEELARR